VEATSSPNVWNVKNVTLASFIIGLLLVVEGAVTIFIGINYFNMDLKAIQTFVMLVLIFTSQFRVLIVRERRHFWSSRPGRELIISSSAALIAFVLVGTYGIVVSPITLAQVFLALAFSALFTLAADFPKVYAFRKFGLS